MQEGQLLMTQAERDRLVTLRKTHKGFITRAQAADELGRSVRQVKRLVKQLRERGDKAAIHRLRGRASNHRIEEKTRDKAIAVLGQEVYQGYGPTLASESLAEEHAIQVSRETLRQWMKQAGLWRARRQRIEKVHLFRPRRSRCGELVQCDTSDHDWLEGRGERLYLIAMIDDATSRLYARFVESDSTEENMRTLWGYLEKYGRPRSFYTDKASLFQTTEKRRRDEPGVDKDPGEMPPTQIGRALRELNVTWIAAHSPQAKGRIERSFQTAQDRLVKGLRRAKANTLAEANRYLEGKFLPWWNATLTVEPACAEDAHRNLDKSHTLAAILSRVETRQVKNDYTFQLVAQRYQIQRASVCIGLRGAGIQVERRLDGSVAARFRGRYLEIQPVEPTPTARERVRKAAPPARRRPATKSSWMKNFRFGREGAMATS
jgi:biotin operon repressor